MNFYNKLFTPPRLHFLTMLLTSMTLFFAPDKSYSQPECEISIFSFEILDESGQPLDENSFFYNCTPFYFEVVINNSSVEPNLIDLSIAYDVDFIVIEDSGPPALTNISFDPITNIAVDSVQLSAAIGFTTYRFDAIVSPLWNGSLSIKNDIIATISKPDCSLSSTQSTIEISPDFQVNRTIGCNTCTTLLHDVAIDPDDTFTALNLLAEAPGYRQDAVILGTLVVDIDYEFTPGSNLMLGRDAKIVYEQGGSHLLKITSTQVQGCSDMWDYIQVGQNNRLEITSSNVSDGKEAVRAEHLSEVKLTGNTFTDNNRSLHIPPNGSGNSISLNVGGNSFESSGALKPPLASQGIPFTGMDINDATATDQSFLPFLFIGAFSGPNQFKDLANGIIATNSNLLISDAQFNDILEQPGFSTSGYAIRSQGGSNKERQLTVLGSFGSGVDMTNCTVGIYSSGENILAQETNMLNVKTGIDIRNGATQGYYPFPKRNLGHRNGHQPFSKYQSAEIESGR